MGNQRRFWFDQPQEKRQVLRSDKSVDRSDDKKEARAEGGRRFQKDGPITEKDGHCCPSPRDKELTLQLQLHN